MLKKLRKILKLSKTFKKHGIVDIILFGSSVRGKMEPRDLDICLIFREKIDISLVRKYEEALRKIGITPHVSYLTVDSFFTKKHALSKTLLFEGRSLISNKNLYENFGMKPFFFYSYELRGLTQSKKTMFLRSIKMMCKEIKPILLGKATFLVEMRNDEKFREVLEYWRVPYNRKKIFFLETF